LVVVWSYEQDKHDGEERGAGKDAEDDVERHLLIAQRAEAPVGQPAATDAYEVHDTVARGAQLRSNDLSKNGHVVAIEDTPAEAEQDEESDRDRQGAGVAHAENGRHDQAHADSTDEDAPARVTLHPAVGPPAAAHRADNRGGLPVERRGNAGLTLIDVELLLENGRHPVAHDPPRQRREREIEHEEDERQIVEQIPGRANRRNVASLSISSAWECVCVPPQPAAQARALAGASGLCAAAGSVPAVGASRRRRTSGTA